MLEVTEPDESEAEAQARNEAMLTSLVAALDGMVRAREAEGGRLRAIVQEQLESIERLVAAIEASPARSPDAIRQRLKEQIGRLLETGVGLDEGRLYQEAAILATRADVAIDEDVARNAAQAIERRKKGALP